VGKLYTKAMRRKTDFGQRMEEKYLLYRGLLDEVNEDRSAQRARSV